MQAIDSILKTQAHKRIEKKNLANSHIKDNKDPF